eukprot:snap_masked-scaffold_20-processed-gene-0.31-mRNA-1 protein AED:1.00 eAED:1.00 QI:0/-1/0/0/-1/1/1/0/168
MFFETHIFFLKVTLQDELIQHYSNLLYLRDNTRHLKDLNNFPVYYTFGQVIAFIVFPKLYLTFCLFIYISSIVKDNYFKYRNYDLSVGLTHCTILTDKYVVSIRFYPGIITEPFKYIQPWNTIGMDLVEERVLRITNPHGMFFTFWIDDGALEVSYLAKDLKKKYLNS